MPRICATTPRGEDGRPVKVRDLPSAINFLGLFVALEQPSGGSFTRYMTVNGYSSYGCVREQPNQGLLKAALAEVHELQQRAANNDPDAINALAVLGQYMAGYHARMHCA